MLYIRLESYIYQYLTDGKRDDDLKTLETVRLAFLRSVLLPTETLDHSGGNRSGRDASLGPLPVCTLDSGERCLRNTL